MLRLARASCVSVGRVTSMLRASYGLVARVGRVGSMLRGCDEKVTRKLFPWN